MKSVKCPNCGNEIVVDESSQYLSCGSCGKCYVNPYYVEKKSADTVDTENTSFNSDKSEHANPVLRCVSCSATLPSDDSSPTLTCPACGRNHKNPFYKPAQAAVVQGNTTKTATNVQENTKQNNKDDTRVISWAYCPQCGNSLDLKNGRTEAYCDHCKKNFVVKRTQDGTIHLEEEKQVINVQQNIVNIQQNIVTAPAKVGESKFTGTYGSLLGNRIVNSLISIFTLGFGIPWVICRSHRWVVDHTVIDGRRLKFDGTGGKLIGAWIKWMFLTLITCGIYGLWVPLKKRAWIVEHSHIEGLAGESKFTGGLASFLGLQIVNFFILVFTLGLGVPWVVCRSMKWDSEHQIIDGRRIYFDGNAAQLFGNWIKWILLTIVTFGIYSILIPIRKQAWIVKHQSFVAPVGSTEKTKLGKADIGKIVGGVVVAACVVAAIITVCITVIPKATHQHSWVWIVDEEATAIETGLKHEECSVCHAKQNENTIIDALGFAGLAYSINKDGETCTITGIGNFTGSNVTIPEEIDGYAVTGIGDNAFRGCKNLTSVTIPNTVTEIGFEAFFGCTNIVKATMPTVAIDYIPKGNLKTVVITGGTSIGDWAFNDCDSLTSIVIPDSVTTIGDFAFDGCTRLTNITFPDSVTSIGYTAFSGCNSLTSIVIPDSVTTIGSSAFEDCTGLTSVTIGNSVTTIGERAFYNCYSLRSITIPASVTTIGERAFSGCFKLVEVYNKSSLNITKGSTGNGYVGYYAFNVYPEEGGSKLSTDEDGYIIDTNGADKILVGYTGTETDVVIPNGITVIYKHAFFGCDSLTSITIPDSVTTIGTSAFGRCTSLTSITIPDSVTSIGDAAFYNCKNLTSVTFEGNSQLTRIGSSTFEGCSRLSSITIPSSVTSIDIGSFSGCTSLTSIIIPDSVTGIAPYAFSDCTSLTDVYYEGTKEKWKSISQYEGGTYLTNATIHYNYVNE